MRRLSHTALVCALAAGCGGPTGPSTVPAPAYDDDAMAREALRLYDQNRDGMIDRSEASGCPGLRLAFDGIDTNRDGRLTSDELKARFAAYRTSGTITSPATVTLNGNLLAGATVKFTPDPCMLGSVMEFTGTTGDDGVARQFTGSDGKDYAGLQAGLYRVSVTKDSAVPAQYNTKSRLGAEVFGGRGSSNLKFSLTDP
jgi:hypothetical protein